LRRSGPALLIPEPPDAGREELRLRVRDERTPNDGVVVVRGGPTSVEGLAGHARRTYDAFVLDGEPIWGVSVFCALDDIGPASLEGLLRRFSSYRAVHLPTVGELMIAGFELLPTFGRPHFTVQLSSSDKPQLSRLANALGTVETNPYHGGNRSGRR